MQFIDEVFDIELVEEEYQVRLTEEEVNIFIENEEYQVILTEEEVNISVEVEEYEVKVAEAITEIVELNTVILERPGALKQSELIGDIDGINRIFKTITKFYQTMVFKNGLLLKKNDDYLEVDDETIEFLEAPLQTGFTDKLQIIYKEK